jgi:hypothetical protein
MKPTEIFKEMAEHEGTLRKAREDVPYGHRPALDMAKVAAANRLLELKNEIRLAYIPNRLLGVFAQGDPNTINAVASFMIRNGEIVLSAESFYSSLADRVEPSYGVSRIFNTTQYNLLIQAISEIGTELGYQQIEAPKYEEKVCLTKADTINHIKTILRKVHIGDQANLELLTKKLIDIIVNYKIESKNILVLITGTDSVEEQNFLSQLFIKSSNFKFNPTFSVTQKNVVALFKNQLQDEEQKTEE